MPEPEGGGRAYPDSATVREALDRFFAENGFGPDGGYDVRWVKVHLKPFPVYFPNTAARVRAVKLHDVHHLLTGYDTSVTGEVEIGGWEIASGCAHHYPAWILNLGSFTMGLAIAPRRLYRAFVRGRRSLNLYPGEFTPELLDRTLGSLRSGLRIGPLPERARGSDVAAFAGWVLVIAAAGAVGVAVAGAVLVRLARALPG